MLTKYSLLSRALITTDPANDLTGISENTMSKLLKQCLGNRAKAENLTWIAAAQNEIPVLFLWSHAKTLSGIWI